MTMIRSDFNYTFVYLHSGLFLKQHRKRLLRENVLTARVDDVWRQKHLPNDFVIEEEDLEEDGYFEDMYPTLEPEELTRFGAQAAEVQLDPLAEVDLKFETNDEEKEEADDVTTLPAAAHVTSHAYTNLVFDVSESCGCNFSEILRLLFFFHVFRPITSLMFRRM